MIVISILNPKGGCGKTTIATNLARSLHERGRQVLLVDSDPQGSARDWHASADNPIPLVALDRPNNLKTLASVGRGYDYVLIDGAAKLEGMIAALVKASDHVLIPVQPSPYDVWAVSDLVGVVKARQDVTGGRPSAAFVISRAFARTTLTADVSDVLKEYGLEVCSTRIVQRQVYPQAAAGGLAVFEARNADAMQEVDALTEEVLSMCRRSNP